MKKFNIWKFNLISLTLMVILGLVMSLYNLNDNYNRLADSHIELQESVIELQNYYDLLLDYTQYLHDLIGGK